jgi:hypothetical protein
MVLYMKETISMERNMDTEISDGQMVPPTKDSSQITMYMEKASKIGLTNVNTKGNGRITKCMVKAFFHGQMVVNTKVAIKMT